MKHFNFSDGKSIRVFYARTNVVRNLILFSWLKEGGTKNLKALWKMYVPKHWMKQMKHQVVWVNGSFDVLHVGHLALFEFAKSLGHHLVVGTDTDERIRQLKGNARPINCLADRMEMLRSLRDVDAVCSFGNRNELLSQIKNNEADIIVVGGDYKDKEVIGSHLVSKVIFFDRIPGYSTTNIIEKMK